MRGRKPKPTRLKLLTGKPGRGLNRNEPQPKPEAPRCPTWLLPRAKKAWKQLAGELSRLGLLTSIDGHGLAVYCQGWAQYEWATKTLLKEGYVVVCAHKEQGSKPHPAFRVQSEAIETIRKFSALFGLNPADRSRLRGPGLPSAADALEQFLDHA
jgi:P27 family predicted phage terminase small subunit